MKQIAGFALFSHLSFCWCIKQRVCVVLLVCAAAAVNSRAQTFTTLANFEGLNGSRPFGLLVQGADGDIYGMTSAGGANGLGTIFKATPDGALTTLYSFGSTPTDGAVPYGGLVQGVDGNFYGTTSESGANSNQVFAGGTVFKITPGGALTTLHSFNVSDGAYPVASLVQGSDGNLYGTTAGGEASGTSGTVFKITPGGTLTTLYNFCEDGCLDGAAPSGPLIQTPDGNFYGTTSEFGAHGYGAVFKMTPEGALTTLYSFGASTDFLPGAFASQGFNPIDGGGRLRRILLFRVRLVAGD